MKTHNIILALATTTLLCACGGGGDDNNAADPKQQTPPEAGNKNAAIYNDRFNEVKTKIFKFPGVTMSVDTIANGHKLLSLSNQELRTDFRSLPQGWYDATGQSVFTDGSNMRDTVKIRSYNGFYSGAYIQKTTKGVSLNMAYGVEPLTADNMPTRGKATYTGVAFNNEEKGTLAYDVDFGKKEGQGKIEGLSQYGTITLQPAKFDPYNEADYVFADVNGIASGKFGTAQYDTRLWGPSAAEISGKVKYPNSEGLAVFQGSRGAISE